MKTSIKMLIAGMLVLFVCTVAYAKIVDLEIEFTMDAEFVPFIDAYKVYTEVPGSGNLEHTATLQKTADFIYQLTAMDLPPGKITNFYLGAVYGTTETAVEDISIAFPYKFTGKPVVIRINKR